MKERKMGMTAEEETCFLYVGGGRSYPTKIQHEQKKEMMLLTEEDNFNRA